MSKEKVEIEYPKGLAYYWNDETNQLNMMYIEIEVYKISDTKVEIDIVDFSHPELLNTTHKYNTFIRDIKSHAEEVSDYDYQDSDVIVIYNGEVLEYKQYTDEELERIKRNVKALKELFKKVHKDKKNE